MTCNCNQPKTDGAQRKGVVKFCDICDPCNEAKSNVRLCAFVVPTLEEGRYYRNSFIFVEEDDSVYYISDDRSEIPFGSRPKFIEDFDPTDAAIHYKSTVVYDVKNQAGYVYDPEGNMVTIALTAAPFSSLVAGEGILVTADGGNYTVAIDPTTVASTDDLHDVTLLVTNHTTQIGNLEEAQDTMAGDIETLEDDLAHAHDLIDDANELAVEAKENAAAAQQTANDALSAVATKQDALTAGTNITIANNVISATDTTYERATAQANGLMSNKDREALINTGLETLQSVTPTATEATIDYTKTVSDANGSTYTPALNTLTIPAATQAVAGLMTATDKTKLDGIDMSTKQDTLIAGDNITIDGRVISATGGSGGGGITVLTEADYNYPADNPNKIAVWLLEPGVYTWGSYTARNNTSFANNDPVSFFNNTFRASTITMIIGYGSYTGQSLITCIGDNGRSSAEVGGYFSIMRYTIFNKNDTTTSRIGNATYNRSTHLVSNEDIVNNLTSTYTYEVLSAAQGKVLKDLIDALDARVTALEGN